MILTPASEQYEHCADEVPELAHAHWREFYKNDACVTYHDPVVAAEQAGDFQYFTLRDEGRNLVGHAGFYIVKLPHINSVMALDAFYYLKPVYRGTSYMSVLLNYAAEHMRGRGIVNVYTWNPPVYDLSKVLVRAGFKPSGEMFKFKE